MFRYSKFGSFLRGAGLLLALAAAGGAVLAQGGRWVIVLDVFSHAAPIYGVVGIVALLLWLIGGAVGRAVPIALAILLASLASLMGPELLAATRQERVEPREELLKVIQFNLQFHNWAQEDTVRWVLAQDADILVIEEVRDEGRGVMKALRRAYPYITPCDWPSPCSARIMSRKAPIATTTPRFDGLGSFATATFQGLKGPYSVVGVHYVWPEPIHPQRANREGLLMGITQLPKESLIISGDFNSTPWSFALKGQDRNLGIERRTRALFSFPATRGIQPPRFLAIDHVYAGPQWKTVSVERGPKLGSDHYPVIVELTR